MNNFTLLICLMHFTLKKLHYKKAYFHTFQLQNINIFHYRLLRRMEWNCRQGNSTGRRMRKRSGPRHR